MADQQSPTPQQPQEPAPQPEADTPQPEKGAGYGALIALVIIVLVILFGAFYFFGERVDDEDENIDLEAQFEASMNKSADQLAQISDQEEDTSLASIEGDLNETDTSDLDAEVTAIEAEFESAE